GSDKREPFSETTKTVLVFGNGAVIRLGSPVAAGQLLFLTNEKTKKEVVCQVVKSKNYKSVSGYVELEFTESVVGFWGMRFPSDRIGTPAPAPTPISSLPSAAKSNVVAPVATAPSPVGPIVSTAPKISDVKSAPIQAARVQTEVKPAQPLPFGMSVAPSPAAKSAAPTVQTIAPAGSIAPLSPLTKKSEAPVVAAPAASSLASSLASLLGAPDVPAAVTSSKPPAAPVATQNKPPAPNVAAENSTQELKVQAARLQEQLSSLLFSAEPTAKSAAPALVAPLEPKAVSDVAAKVLEIAKSEPSPVKAAAPAKPLPAPMKSSLDTEEVKIPSWLEPLARNAAVPAPPPAQEPMERGKNKQLEEIAAHEAHAPEALSLTAEESAPEPSVPAFGSLLPLDEPVITHERSSGGSGRGVLYGAIAAGVLLVAGGAWYFLHQPNAVPSTSGTVAPAANSQANVAPSALSVIPPASQVGAQNPTGVSGPIATPVSNTPASSLSGAKSTVSSQPVPVTRDKTHGAGTTIPAAVTERISRPPAEPAPVPAPKKPALGDVHLASPTVNRTAAAQDDGAEAPAISSGNADAVPGTLDSGLEVGNAKQPAAPEAPLPIGGDVKSAKLISSASPVYPAMARNQHVSGDVRVDALIDANGRVTTMKVISGPALLHQAAMDALRQWKYQAATLDGKAVPMHLTVTIQFRLQ
ncbi:MAG TPA: TonB family protein, partial [Candidatus Acidoferrum sp.]